MSTPALTFFDTSTLVAALFPDHPRHGWATTQRGAASALGISTHTLAETYKVLTVHPRLGIQPADATRLLEAATANMTKVTLDPSLYFAAMRRCVDGGLPGSIIFDALIALAAVSAGAAALVTLNPRDFKGLGKDVAGIVVHP
ncbi:type II toxin-antitoxin system VapC family toxin [Deinococcus aetherius]|uniref:type II toxin-antitoxin system VapC family toxin n=1 Tax=Deinococcus aetherius TaxID=200252 RepID=UPI00222FD4D1|nr:PIN domain-containing protein [Deinococcus aetherius]